uniref:Uncharacterized protein n=1 Tax=Arundo donax TaxID=35708 RepID=A0A0A9FUE4_ARUDO
MKLSTQTKHK